MLNVIFGRFFFHIQWTAVKIWYNNVWPENYACSSKKSKKFFVLMMIFDDYQFVCSPSTFGEVVPPNVEVILIPATELFYLPGSGQHPRVLWMDWF